MARATKSAPTARTSAPRSTSARSAGRSDAGSTKVAKSQMIEMIAGRTSLNKKQAGDAVNAAMECIVTALREGKSVGLPGLGTLSVAQTAERQGVRPGTSERITIPAGRKVRFKVASTLKGNL
ncbi:HU family DNA-binding protein [Deinococcus taklimakanensis]|uniref:HU family DNA-binding protein n=1 Tax=Deinococcus taklimakanensis TaxID=536443 RepID=A0ABW5P3C4_9DEIO